MRIIDGATISFARRRSGIPLERRRCVARDCLDRGGFHDSAQKVDSALLICESAFLMRVRRLARPARASLTFL
jgi:hypothetical protein